MKAIEDYGFEEKRDELDDCWHHQLISSGIICEYFERELGFGVASEYCEVLGEIGWGKMIGFVD